MNATVSPEYRQLGYDTSNDMIRHDARRGDRKYAEAALHIRNAGLGRLQMGEMMFDAGEIVYAAEDWLSAAACFYLVPDLERMRDAFDRVRKLDQEGKIPLNRRDIHEAIKERAEQIKTLERKLAQFRDRDKHANDQEILNWLLAQVRELPGLPELHSAIARVATRLAQTARASEHIAWAEKFAPNDAQVEKFHPASSNGIGEIHPASADSHPTS